MLRNIRKGPIVLGSILQALLLIVGLFLIMIILLQRGRGGGLAGAFGGTGGQSAFGTKAGDVFTWITVGTATVWVLLAGISGCVMRTSSDQFARSKFAAEAAPEGDITSPAAAAAEGEKKTEEPVVPESKSPPEGTPPADDKMTPAAPKSQTPAPKVESPSQAAPEKKPESAPTSAPSASTPKSPEKPVEKPAQPAPADAKPPQAKPETAQPKSTKPSDEAPAPKP
jgi:preprotein translocase subunit SecG